MDDLENTTKKYLTSLLTSTPLVLNMQQLTEDYRNTIGEPIPYQKLGYNTLEHFLRSIPDCVKLLGSGPRAEVHPIISNKSSHINELVTNQKINNKKPKKNPKRGINQFNSRGINQFNSRQHVTSTPIFKKRIHYPQVNEKSTFSSNANGFYSTGKSNCKFENSLASCSSGFDLSQPVLTKSTNLFMSQCKTKTNYENKSNNTRMETYGSEEKQKSQNVFDKPVGATRYMHGKALPNKLFENASSVNERLEKNVPYQIKTNLKKLIGQCPKGIWCADVPKKYRDMFNSDLHYQELGYRSMVELCISLNSIFHYVRPSTEDFKLYDRNQPLPDCAEKTYTIASYGESTAKKKMLQLESSYALPLIDWTDAVTYLPSGVFKLGQEIPRAFIPIDVKENDVLDIMVGEVYDPSKFWIYVADTLLDDLMDGLQEFYKENASEYLIPDHLIKEGLYCVQVIFGEYHRALIVDTMPDVEDTIRVIFFDYGTMTKVSTKGLCFLHEDFSLLPAQSIRCRLAYIHPLEDGAPWTREASKAFRRLVANRDMSIKISVINWEHQFLEVYLADVTDPDNVFYINDKLVEEGFAQYPDKEKQASSIDPIYTSKVKYLHLFPTFLELEHGLAPSTAEMEVFQDCEVPINFCYPQYFDVDHSIEERLIKEMEEFFETYSMKGVRNVPAHFYGLEKFKPTEMDWLYFGKLEAEIKEFNNKPAELECSSSNDEVFDDAIEVDLAETEAKDDSNIDNLTEQLMFLCSKEEETVEELKKDLLMTENIMNDINMICKSEYNLTDEKLGLLQAFQGSELNAEYVFEEDSKLFLQHERDLYTINETKESIVNDELLIKKQYLNENKQIDEMFHPLSKMSFDNHNHTDDETDSINSPNSNVDLGFNIRNYFSSRLSDGSTDYALDSSLSQEIECVPYKNSQENKDDSSVKQTTNPFLDGSFDVATNASDTVPQLNPNNPFLTYLKSKEKKSENGDAPKVNETFATESAKPSWKNFSDMSLETISLLGRSLSSSGSVRMSEKENCSISTQTSDKQPVHATVPQNNPHPQYYQPPLPPPSYPVCNNPYYNVQYGAYPGSPYVQPQYRMLRPPPGFHPTPSQNPQYPGGLHFGSTPTAVQPSNYYPGFNQYYGQDMSMMLNRYCAPQMPQFNAPVNVPLPSNPVNSVSQAKDFYDVYNEKLRMLSENNGK